MIEAEEIDEKVEDDEGGGVEVEVVVLEDGTTQVEVGTVEVGGADQWVVEVASGVQAGEGDGSGVHAGEGEGDGEGDSEGDGDGAGAGAG